MSNIPSRLNPGDGSDVVSWQNPDGSVSGRYDSVGRRRATIQATAPTKAAGAGAGTSPTVALVAGSTDEHGQLTVTTGASGSGAGSFATITFNQAYGSAPVSVIVSPNDAASALLNPYASATTTVLTIGVGTAPASATAYKFNYLVVGGK